MGHGYELNQGGIEEPNPIHGWKAIDDKGNGDDAFGGWPLIGGAGVFVNIGGYTSPGACCAFFVAKFFILKESLVIRLKLAN